MKDNPVAKHAHKFNKAQVHKDKKKAMKKGERKHKGSYESVDEVLNVSDGIAAWIKDFQSSDAPQFQGKSDAKRKEMAIAAYLDAKKGGKEEACWQGYTQKGMKKKGDRVVPNCVPEETNEDLRKWFGKGKKGDWVRVGTDGEIKGDCARDEGEGKPKCMPRSKAHSMSKKDRGSSARRKRRADPEVDRPGTGNKPIMVKTDKKESVQEKTLHINLDAKDSPRQRQVTSVLKRYEKSGKIEFDGETDKGALFKINKPGVENEINKELKRLAGGYRLGEAMQIKPHDFEVKYKGKTYIATGKRGKVKGADASEYRNKSGGQDRRVWRNHKTGEIIPEGLIGESLEEKNVPNNPKLWAKFKSQAKSKFDVYPSAYANGWAAKQYKAAGGTWKTVKEDVNELSKPTLQSYISKSLKADKKERDAGGMTNRRMKGVVKARDKVLKKEEVEIEEDVHARYMRAHGKKAKGQGQWMFTTSRTGDTQGKEFSQRGDFSAAHKAAQKHFGTKNVYVMESTAAYGKSMADIRAKKQRAGMTSSDRNKMSKVADMMRREREKKAQRKEGVDEAMSPSTVKYKGKTYYSTGKKGKDAKTGAQSFEYSSDMDGADERVWYNTKTKRVQAEGFDEAMSPESRKAHGRMFKNRAKKQHDAQQQAEREKRLKAKGWVRNDRGGMSKVSEGPNQEAYDRFAAQKKSPKGGKVKAPESEMSKRLKRGQRDDPVNKLGMKREDVNEELTATQKQKHKNLQQRAKGGNAQAKKRLAAFEKEFAKDLQAPASATKMKASSGVKDTKDVGGGDDHIVMQLRKAQDVGGNMDIKVSPTGKTVRLKKQEIDKLLKLHDKMQKPDEKRKFRILVTKKLRDKAK